MIAILTNDGSLQIARALSGGELFLVYGAALLDGQPLGTNPYDIAATSHEVTVDEGETTGIDGNSIVRMIPCTGILPVEVKEGDTSAWAVDFDFNTQLPTPDDGDSSNSGSKLSTAITYQTVCMLGRRYRQYKSAEWNKTYYYGDHVWYGTDRSTAYVCITDSDEGYVYTEGSLAPNEDGEHWAPVSMQDVLQHPGDKSYYSDPAYDSIVMHVTSYDEAMTMGNGIEWEYKVRVFLDNLVQNDISKIEKFAQGTEANGSLTLSFMAEIALNFRALRDMVSPMA